MQWMRLLVVAGLLASGTGCFRESLPRWDFLGKDTKASQSTEATPTGPSGSVELPAKQSAELSLNMAESLEKEGKDLECVIYYERARELDPSLNDRAAHRLAVVYDRLDEQAKAMKEFQDLLKRHPRDSMLLSDIGYSYYNRGQWTEAESYLRRALDVDKKNMRAWMNLGMTLAQLDRTKDAIEAFEKAVTPAEARSNLGFVLASRGKTAEAIAAYRESLKLEPTSKVARAALAKLESGEASAQRSPRAGS